MGISVVVCCYNSAMRLPATLQYLSAQVLPEDVPWEVIVVDNASTDSTKAVAIKEWKGEAGRIKVLSESKQGLSYAREAGIKAAQYEYVVFCDDDNWLAPDYLQKAYDTMLSDAMIGACGGIGIPAFEGVEPAWFRRYELVFAVGRQSMYEGELGWDVGAIYGAGLVVRRDVLMTLYAQKYNFLLSGRKGAKLSGGEDYELQMILRMLGYKIYYTEALKFEHLMPAVRMTRAYLERIVYGSALGSAVIFIYADVARYLQTGKARYKVNWFKDLLKAVNSARMMVTDGNSVPIAFARLRGGLRSVMSNLFNYGKYRRQIEQIPTMQKEIK